MCQHPLSGWRNEIPKIQPKHQLGTKMRTCDWDQQQRQHSSRKEKQIIMTWARKWDGEATNDGVWEGMVAVAGVSPGVGAQPSLWLAPWSEKTLKQKDHLLEKEREREAERSGGRGTVEEVHCTKAFQNCVSETLAPSQHSRPVGS